MTGSWSEEWQWHGVLEKEPRHARRDAVRMRAASDANRRCAVLAERACVSAREKKSAACLAFSASFPWCSFINNVGGLQSPEGDSPLTQLVM